LEESGAGQRGFGRLFEFLVHAIHDFAHFERQTVGLVDAADLVVAESRAQKPGELAVAVKSFVVDLDHKHMVEAVQNLADAEKIAKQLQETLGYPHYARTVFQSYRNLFSWVELQKKLSPILMGLIIIVAAVNIVGTLLMFVLEKTQAIGILKSLGANSKNIQRIFRMQGLVIAFTGILAGNAVALMLCWLQMRFKLISLPSDIYFMNSVPVLLQTENFVFVSAVAFLLCMVATLLPSKAAARLDTIAALRFG